MKRQKSRRSKTHKSNRKSAVSVGGGNEGCAIVMAYWGGEKYVEEQINSIHRQTYDSFHLYIYDDASPLPFDVFAKERQIDLRKITICRRQHNVGVYANFLNGLAECGDNHAYYAYCDQDDIWHDDKLARAVAWLERQTDGPAVFFSSARIVDSTGRKSIANPVILTRPLTFANALVETQAGGNTIVMNKTARDLVVDTSRATPVALFDWWTSLIVVAAGGKLHFDPEPAIDYRQHDSNDKGAGLGVRITLKRICWHLGGRFKRWNDTNVAALNKHRKRLTPENRRILDQFATARKAWLPARIIGLRRSGISRQSLAGNTKLAIAILLGKI